MLVQKRVAVLCGVQAQYRPHKCMNKVRLNMKKKKKKSFKDFFHLGEFET